MKTNRGFTLIELLVVIAIIGILASIVLASLSGARDKGNDAKIKEQLANMRAAAEIYNSSHGNYSTAVDCSTGMFIDTISGMNAITTAKYPFGALVCQTNSDGTKLATEWSALAPLSTSGHFWCVDSTGKSQDQNSGSAMCL